ncbi:MAG: hypothetical protein FJ027_18435 [Candidatus Rokubacteria bacterium]|nr:hypothetical protein [Candidatus Rokubacteria bacterium]
MTTVDLNLRSLTGSTVITARHARRVTVALLRRLQQLPASGLLTLDLDGIEVMSARFCSELADTLIRRRLRRQDKYFVLVNVGDEAHAAITAALRLRQKPDAVLAVRPRYGLDIIGHYPSFLRAAFIAVKNHEPVTAAEAAALLKIKPAIAAERLRRLAEWGFVVRQAKVSARRAVFEYTMVPV